MNVKIFVACHKPCEVFHDEIYTPIHVGRAISKYKDEMKGFIGDDTGDNISTKNPSYCELTAQYWAWKNYRNVDYIGFCHYRRYFRTQITAQNIAKELEGYDMIVAQRVIMPKNIRDWLCCSIVAEDVYILYNVLLKHNSDSENIINDFFSNRNYVYPCNMFVCNRKLFDDFAKWQFGILKDVENYVIPSGYTRLKRVFGYMAEALLNLYIEINGLKIKEMSLVNMIGDKNAIMSSTLLQKLKTNIRFYTHPHNLTWDYALIAGLKADGIYDKIKFNNE